MMCSLMRVVVEMILLLIEDDAVCKKVAHESLGVKFVILNLINEEIQREADFEEQFVQDCLWVWFSLCDVSNQGAFDVVASNGLDLLYYVCECKPSLVVICLKIMRVLLIKFPAIILASFLNAQNLKQM
jgi:hypothetical protein